MTNVRIYETDERVVIRMEGHAEYDRTGRDIVCAACSVLIQSLINTLHVLGVPNSWKQDDGKVGLTFPKRGDEKQERAMGAFTMCKVGFEMLAASYPKHVTIQE